MGSSHIYIARSGVEVVQLGTTTKVETVNRALAEIAARPRRVAFLETLRTADDDLGDPEIMRGAWR